MDHITRFKRQLARRIFMANCLLLFLVVGSGFLGVYVLDLDRFFVTIFVAIISFVGVLLSSWYVHSRATQPIEFIERIVSYATHNNRGESTPDLNKVKLAHELLESLSMQIYDLASTSSNNTKTATSSSAQTQAQDIQTPPQLIHGLGAPIIGIDTDQTITMANNALAAYVDKPLENIVGQKLYDVLAFSFQGEETFDDWLKNSKESSVTATRSWERVKHIIDQDTAKQFDMIASFSSGNSTGTETLLALFDKSERYGQDDSEVGFVALAVHELRTPLTIMRGYIEVFEDELGPTLSPELTTFMHKMHASAQQLAAFVSNILNVARVEENQLVLKLHKEDWPVILKNAIEDLELRARVHGKHIELNVADNLPAVAVDRISAHEVINNLVDNAIKYGGNTEKIVITSQINSDGLIETSVQDFGIGIPASVMPELFRKFHRSHRSREQTGGTGLGLFLCKSLIAAHGGNIWVHSKEGEGSIFSFTLIPYDQVAEEQLAGEDGIIRGAHGWIKNHSMYRN